MLETESVEVTGKQVVLEAKTPGFEQATGSDTSVCAEGVTRRRHPQT